MIDAVTLWTVIIVMGVFTFLIRLSFLGLIGRRNLPEWVLRHLRYTAVGVLPGLVAPLVIWPAATGGQPEPARMAAAAVALGVGIWTRSVLGSMVAGALVLYGVLWIAG